MNTIYLKKRNTTKKNEVPFPILISFYLLTSNYYPNFGIYQFHAYILLCM